MKPQLYNLSFRQWHTAFTKFKFVYCSYIDALMVTIFASKTRLGLLAGKALQSLGC